MEGDLRDGGTSEICAEEMERINRLKRRQLTRIVIAMSLTVLLIAITSYLVYVRDFEGLKTFYSVFGGIYGAVIGFYFKEKEE